MNNSALKTELNIRLDDTDNFAFTSEEKDSILTEATNDPYAVSIVWDESLTFTEGTWQYAVPATITNVRDIYVKASSNDDPEPIALKWEVVDGNIQFKGRSRIIPNGYTLYLKGNYKYTTSDTVSEVRVQEYILNLAQLLALNKLGIKKVLKFLKNDTSVSEIISLQRELERKVSQHRNSIQKEFQAA